MGKMEILTPRKIETIEQIDTICQDWLRPREECLFRIW